MLDGHRIVTAHGQTLFCGTLTTPSLAELRAEPLRDRGPSRLTEIIADVRDLHADPANASATFMVASQFNLLEMPHPGVTPEDGIRAYADDHTQGPACAMACGAGTLYRNYFVPLPHGPGQSAAHQIDTAADLHRALGGDIWQMRNGYALPLPGGLTRAAERLASRDLSGHLRIGVQAETEVTITAPRHRVTQVYASALPIAYANEPLSAWEPLARLVLEASYEATLRIAARTPDRPCFLTLLGGGVFGNPQAWILDALHAAVAKTVTAGLDLCLVSYSHPVLDT